MIVYVPNFFVSKLDVILILSLILDLNIVALYPGSVYSLNTSIVSDSFPNKFIDIFLFIKKVKGNDKIKIPVVREIKMLLIIKPLRFLIVLC